MNAGPAREKTVGAAYTLLFFLGSLGGHKFYLGKPAAGLIYMFAWGAFGAQLMGGGHWGRAAIPIALLWIALTYDLATLSKQVSAANEASAKRLRETPSADDELVDYSHADAIVARYLAQKAVTDRQPASAAASGEPAFGRQALSKPVFGRR